MGKKKNNRKAQGAPDSGNAQGGKPLARVLVIGGGLHDQLEDAGGVQVYAAYTDAYAVRAIKEGKVHALVLTGGVDISPRLYGAAPHARTQSANNARDKNEVLALQAAFAAGIPVLGICRGSQLINAAFGGTLHQHIADLPNTHRYHLGHDHRVELVTGSRLRRALRKAEPWVTSIHHQAVARVAPGFKVAARAKDGTVEAIEIANTARWVVGVQFHPEIGTNGMLQGLFNALVAAAATRANLPAPVTREPKARRVVTLPPAKVNNGRTRNSSIGVPITRAEVQAPRNAVDPRITAWTCFRCGVQFDDRVDHLDHMWILHDVDLLDNGMSNNALDNLFD